VYTAPETLTREREINSLYVTTAVVVLVIVTVTFGALIFAFFWRSQNGYLWAHLRIPSLLWITTLILAASSLTLEGARRKLKADDRPSFNRLLRATAGLGLLFLIGQAAAWFQVMHSDVILEQDKHSWFIFLFSGMHAIHILAGLGGLSYLLYRTYEPASGPRYQMTTKAATNAISLFWHYLGFIWLVLFVLLLTWRR
jgi:cytochrome c oxidase subunit 3